MYIKLYKNLSFINIFLLILRRGFIIHICDFKGTKNFNII